MFIPQTLDEYLDNPMGKGSTAIANRNLIKDDLNRRYDNLIKKYETFKHYHYFDNNSFYIHVKVPSESERKNDYDVVIQFVATDKAVEKDLTLARYTLKVFSNCPSFTYTYAYVYNDYDIMIDFLKDKYKSIVLKDNPVIKNPGEIINFEKSVYFACKFIKANQSMFLNKVGLVAFSNKLVIKKFKETIRNTDQIELDIKKELNRLKEEKEKALRNKKPIESKPKKETNKTTGTPKKSAITKTKPITPHAKIHGKPKVRSTIKK